MVNGPEFLISWIGLGFAAGISPGPLLALVFSETLKYGRKGEIKIAISPLIADLPIILFVLFVLLSLKAYSFVIGTIFLFGALYLIYLGIENLKVKINKFKVEHQKKTFLNEVLLQIF